MRRTFFALMTCGCIAGSASMQRDDRILRELTRQERWSQQALDAKPTREQLDAIRGGDYGSVGAARKELTRLVMSIDRGTWIRDTSAELLRDGPDPQLSQEFDRGGRIRADAIQAADELAEALADARGGLTVSDLKPAFDALHHAQASEDKLSHLAGTPGAPRLSSSPVPVPEPFIDAAAKLVSQNPDLAKDLDRLPQQEQTKIRAKMADSDRAREEQKHVAEAPPPPVTPAPPPPAGDSAPPAPPKEAEMPSNTLKIANDAAGIIGKKAPNSITLREDGLFALSYDDADYLVDPDGKLVRKETPQR